MKFFLQSRNLYSLGNPRLATSTLARYSQNGHLSQYTANVTWGVSESLRLSLKEPTLFCVDEYQTRRP